MGAKAEAAQQELAAFKEQVRAEAIRVAAAQRWCDSGLNDTLRRLGLAEKQQPRRVRVPLAVPASITVDVEGAASDAEALEQIRRNPELALGVGRRMYGAGVALRLPEPAAPATPTAPGATPAVGDPKPEYGEFHSPSGYGRQCLTHDEADNWCTRDRAHGTPHVASDSRRVLAVWDGNGSRFGTEEPRYAEAAGAVAREVADDDDDDDETSERAPW